jgi:hypothetical protein
MRARTDTRLQAADGLTALLALPALFLPGGAGLQEGLLIVAGLACAVRAWVIALNVHGVMDRLEAVRRERARRWRNPPNPLTSAALSSRPRWLWALFFLALGIAAIARATT